MPNTESHGSARPKGLGKEAEITRCWAKEQGLRSQDEAGSSGQVGSRAWGSQGNCYGAVEGAKLVLFKYNRAKLLTQQEVIATTAKIAVTALYAHFGSCFES